MRDKEVYLTTIAGLTMQLRNAKRYDQKMVEFWQERIKEQITEMKINCKGIVYNIFNVVMEKCVLQEAIVNNSYTCDMRYFEKLIRPH